jgi:maltose O-acetyltransferase
VIQRLIDLVALVRARIDDARIERRWSALRAAGMHIGEDVLLPASTWIDACHCHLIHIGDHTGFGEQCLILAHDAQMDEFLDAARIGRIRIFESCHIGACTVILPGVDVGPRTIVGSNSVVAKSLPPDTVCAGNPAKVICSLDEYLDRHREQIRNLPNFRYDDYDIRSLSPERRKEMVRAVASADAYIVGGRTAELAGTGGTKRTPARAAGHDGE